MSPEQQLRVLGDIALSALAVNAVIAGLALFRRRRGRALLAARWSVVDVWVGVQVIVTVLLGLSLLIGIVAFSAGVSLTEMGTLSSQRALLYVALPGVVVQDLLFFVVPAACINLRYRLPLRAIGLPPVPRRRDLVAGIALGLAAIVVSGFLSAGIDAFAEHFRHVAWVGAAIAVDKNNPVASVTKMLPKFGAVGLILTVLGVGVAAPFGEEMLFRGFAFNALKRRLGLWPGILISSLLFTLPHSYGLGLIPVFAVGILLAWTYNNSGSLWVTIALHATNNTVQVLLAYFLPNLFRG